MDISILTLIFLFFIFIGFVSGIAMFTSKEQMSKTVAFVITAFVNIFFSILNLIIIETNDYRKLVFCWIILFFALTGIMLRVFRVKAGNIPYLIIFITMIVSVINIFR